MSRHLPTYMLKPKHTDVVSDVTHWYLPKRVTSCPKRDEVWNAKMTLHSLFVGVLTSADIHLYKSFMCLNESKYSSMLCFSFHLPNSNIDIFQQQ